MKSLAKIILVLIGSFLLLALLLIAALWLLFPSENWNKRKARFEKAGETGMKIVAAINQYTTDHGAAPTNLQVLVPRYLAQIPNTGLRDYPVFDYLTFTNSKLSLAWYDLGSRNGKPMAGLWVRVEGDPEHDCLALTLDQNHRVVDARVDRMPEEYERLDFDSTKWRRQESRIAMARSISEHFPLMGAAFTDIKLVLGEPTGISILRDSPWELRIKCSQGVLNWDVFFYWPTEDYPKHIYGGNTELIGKWAYVHE